MRQGANVLNCPDTSPRLIEHVRLVDHKLVPDRLEMQPADVFAADMFAAVARAVVGNADRLDAGGLDSSCCWQQRSSAMNQKAAASMLWRLAVSRPWFWWIAALTPLKALATSGPAWSSTATCAGLVGDHDVILEEGAGVLRDRLQRAARGATRCRRWCARGTWRGCRGAPRAPWRAARSRRGSRRSSPSTTLPAWSTRIRLETLTCAKCTHIGLVQ